ncbi:hypothetical protein ACTNEY_14930 [Fusicatenibacter saccharivorans]|uniref:hypothetical protein n=1 Tax=Fusicatenibacter saccharivorans TaxID=1150298 RepID=UPI003F89D6AA
MLDKFRSKSRKIQIQLQPDPERKERKRNRSIPKKITAECFHYKRKNIVWTNGIVFTLPVDTPPEQERAFFEESLKYLISTLPMGKKCIFLAEVHCDEGQILKDGKTIVEGQKHLHVMYVPAVPDLKHEGYSFKLCSDALTRRSVLMQWHPKYQAWLDAAGVKGTVYSGKTSGKGISVKSLKEISKTTGLSFEQIQDLEKEKKHLLAQIHMLEKEQALSKRTIEQNKSAMVKLKNMLLEHEQTIQMLQGNEKIHTAEKESLLSILKEKESLLSATQEKLQDLNVELQRSNEKITELEHENTALHSPAAPEHEHTWGNDSWGNHSWGTQSECGNTLDKEKEHLW